MVVQIIPNPVDCLYRIDVNVWLPAQYVCNCKHVRMYAQDLFRACRKKSKINLEFIGES